MLKRVQRAMKQTDGKLKYYHKRKKIRTIRSNAHELLSAIQKQELRIFRALNAVTNKKKREEFEKKIKAFISKVSEIKEKEKIKKEFDDMEDKLEDII